MKTILILNSAVLIWKYPQREQRSEKDGGKRNCDRQQSYAQGPAMDKLFDQRLLGHVASGWHLLRGRLVLAAPYSEHRDRATYCPGLDKQAYQRSEFYGRIILSNRSGQIFSVKRILGICNFRC